MEGRLPRQPLVAQLLQPAIHSALEAVGVGTIYIEQHLCRHVRLIFGIRVSRHYGLRHLPHPWDAFLDLFAEPLEIGERRYP